MSKLAMWNSTTRGQRLIADLVSRTSYGPNRYPMALVVGAGVDIALGRKDNWPNLLFKLATMSGIDDDRAKSLKALAYDLPTESAEALRNLIGPELYWENISKWVANGKIEKNTSMAKGINDLIKTGMRLIISLNYTPEIISAIKEANPNSTIRVIDRTNLPAWNYQSLLYPSHDSIHIIFIHGKVESNKKSGPSAVLDRSEYDSAIFSSIHYSDLWRRLFQDFSVITVGVSWTDIPIRNAAAEVQFAYPISARQHYALFGQKKEILQDMWKERGMISAYSVHPIFYNIEGKSDHKQAGLILTELSRKKNDPSFSNPIECDQIIQMANFLDAFGDYESSGQSVWMSNNWEIAKNAILFFDEQQLSQSAWLALARIERHIRHFLWFYLASEEKVKLRKELWLKVAELWKKLTNSEKEKLWNTDRIINYSVDSKSRRRYISQSDRGVLEFGLGSFEIKFCEPAEPLPPSVLYWRDMFTQLEVNSTSIWGMRSKIAKGLWVNPTNDRNELYELRKKASLCHWEGIESKIVLDVFQNEFFKNVKKNKKPRDWKDSTKKYLLPIYSDAFSVSKNAGCLRREIGALVQGSFFLPIKEAERNLLAVHERFFENDGRSKEFSTVWWIYIGLVAVYCEQRQSSYKYSDVYEWLNQSCGKIRLPSDNLLSALKNNAIPHWREYHKTAANLTEEILINKCPNYKFY